MNSPFVGKLVGFLAALSLTSFAFPAPPKITTQATDMLQQIHDDAHQVRVEADQLAEFNREPFLIDWRMQADTLETLKYQINHMDQAFSRLRADEASLPQHERTEVNEIAPALVELTDTAQAAMDFLSSSQDLTWLPQYQAYADEMYTQARRVEQYSLGPVSNPIVDGKVNHSTGTLNPSSGS
jgi:hypothetical protein